MFRSGWGHGNLETTLIYAHADTEMKRKAIEMASAGISSIPETETLRQNEYDDAELKRLYGLRLFALGYADFCFYDVV